MTERHVLSLQEIDRTQLALVGGKGANLGELARIEGTRVPAGFCDDRRLPAGHVSRAPDR